MTNLFAKYVHTSLARCRPFGRERAQPPRVGHLCTNHRTSVRIRPRAFLFALGMLTSFRLRAEPNRLAAYVGATKSAKASGDQAKAREYAAQIARLTTNADVSRPELIEIRETTGTKL